MDKNQSFGFYLQQQQQQSFILLFYYYVGSLKDHIIITYPQQLTSQKPIIRSLRGEVIDPPPVWLMRQAGRYLPEYMDVRSRITNFLDLCYNPNLSAEVTIQPIKRYGLDAAIIFSDILVVPDALGQNVDFKPGLGPVLTSLRTREEVAELQVPLVTERLQPVYESISNVVSKLGPKVTMIGFAGAPWTVATYMVEGGSSKNFNLVKNWATGDPESFRELIKKLVDGTILHLIKQVEAGAEVIQIFDSWAGVLSPGEFQSWCVEPVFEIVRCLKMEFPELPIIGFPRGAGVAYQDYASGTGVDGVSVDYTVDLKWIADKVQINTAVQGNLDPHILRVGGSIMREEVSNIKNALGKAPFIFNLGHGILPDTPPANVADLVGSVRGSRG